MEEKILKKSKTGMLVLVLDLLLLIAALAGVVCGGILLDEGVGIGGIMVDPCADCTPLFCRRVVFLCHARGVHLADVRVHLEVSLITVSVRKPRKSILRRPNCSRYLATY